MYSRVPGDERLDWRMTSREVFNFVRALSEPGPRAVTSINSVPVMISKVELIPGAPIYKGFQVLFSRKNKMDFLLKLVIAM